MNLIKPHYQWKEIFAVTNEIVKPESTAVPNWMRAASTGASFGNIDSSDLKPPRLKILAGQSPEVTDGIQGAVPGNFWVTILNVNLGKEVTGTPIFLRKSYQVWAPKGGAGGEQKGPLATASDGIHWDVPNQTFEVQFPGNPKVYKWHIKRTVIENGSHKFGTQQDDNPSSKPIATLTYDTLWLIDLPNGVKQLCVFTASRTGITPTQNFISATRAMGVDQYFQRYRIIILKKTGPTGDPYFTCDYQYIGNVQSEADGKFTRGLWEQYSKSGFVTDMADEADEIRSEKKKDWGPETHDDKEEIPF